MDDEHDLRLTKRDAQTAEQYQTMLSDQAE
jgi:hypothetical protein